MPTTEEHEIKLVPTARMQAKLLSVKPLRDVDEILRKIRGMLGLADLKVLDESVEIISDEYFDTPKLRFFGSNGVCRLRRRGNAPPELVVKKLLEKEIGLIRRSEYTRETTEAECRVLVEDGFRGFLADIVPEVAGERLRYTIKVRNERRNLVLERGDERYCLSLDCFVSASRRGRSTSGEQIELELEATSPAAALRLASIKRDLRDALPDFDFATDTKYERGVKHFYLNRALWLQWLRDWSSSPGLSWIALIATILFGAAGLWLTIASSRNALPPKW